MICQYHFYVLKIFKVICKISAYLLKRVKLQNIFKGAAVGASPVALAAYLLEKFSTWTNPDYRFRPDGGLLEKYTLDELLDNVMLYWVTNSITTSVRIYTEQFTKAHWASRIDEYVCLLIAILLV